jgi:hypothetical protein
VNKVACFVCSFFADSGLRFAVRIGSMGHLGNLGIARKAAAKTRGSQPCQFVCSYLTNFIKLGSSVMNTQNANRPMMRAVFSYANIGTQSMPRFLHVENIYTYLHVTPLRNKNRRVKWATQQNNKLN